MALENPSRWAAQGTIEALAEYPCLRCLSDTQLMLVLAYLLCVITSNDRDNECTVSEMMTNAGCSDCFSRRQKMQYLVQMVATYAQGQGLLTNFDAITEQIACLVCADTSKILAMVVDGVETGINNGTLFNPAP
jgi:hypothetical protein